MEINRRNLLRMAVVGSGAILMGYGLLRYFSSPFGPKKIKGPAEIKRALELGLGASRRKIEVIGEAIDG